jgi:hypothetical protein
MDADLAWAIQTILSSFEQSGLFVKSYYVVVDLLRRQPIQAAHLLATSVIHEQ